MNNKKVILVNGNGSKWYEQAIFIVNKNDANIPKNIVFEAEKIINEYLNKKYPDNISNVYNNSLKNNTNLATKTLVKKQPKKSNKKLNMYLNLSIICTISIILCLLYLILS